MRLSARSMQGVAPNCYFNGLFAVFWVQRMPTPYLLCLPSTMTSRYFSEALFCILYVHREITTQSQIALGKAVGSGLIFTSKHIFFLIDSLMMSWGRRKEQQAVQLVATFFQEPAAFIHHLTGLVPGRWEWWSLLESIPGPFFPKAPWECAIIWMNFLAGFIR